MSTSDKQTTESTGHRREPQREQGADAAAAESKPPQQEPQQQAQQQQGRRDRPQFEYHSSRFEYSSGGGDVARYHGERREESADAGPRWKAVNLDLRPDGHFTLNERAGSGRGEEASEWQRVEGNWSADRGRVNFKVERQESKGLDKAITGGRQHERLQVGDKPHGEGQKGQGEGQQRAAAGGAMVAHDEAAGRRSSEHLRGVGAMHLAPIEDEFDLAIDDLLSTEPFVSPWFRVPLMTSLVPRFLLDEFRG